jgi:CDP-glucose 4,6-dehydratase
MLRRAFKGRTVFLTGHTGFKGAWLSEWLLMLEARIVGFALDPPTTPSLYQQLALERRIEKDIRADIRDAERLQLEIERHRPDFVFHLAAQTLVGQSYRDPVYNHQTNIMGTINVLEAVRRAGRDCVVVLVTTDKVYENKEWDLPYREDDPLGGFDPYSASKACCEIIASSYRRSFFGGEADATGTPRVCVATARAGNVIGGGDWATDRIVPDCVRSLASGEAVPVRNMSATRPWQHVLEPLGGYLLLAARLAQASQGTDPASAARRRELCGAFNFGPNTTSNRTVADLVQEVLKHWPGSWVDRSSPSAPHEAGTLNMASDRAYHQHGWSPQRNVEQTDEKTVDW